MAAQLLAPFLTLADALAKVKNGGIIDKEPLNVDWFLAQIII